jgi:hypothetical protein
MFGRCVRAQELTRHFLLPLFMPGRATTERVDAHGQPSPAKRPEGDGELITPNRGGAMPMRHARGVITTSITTYSDGDKPENGGGGVLSSLLSTTGDPSANFGVLDPEDRGQRYGAGFAK